MSDLLKSLTGGISRFVFAWILPSALTLGLIRIFLVKFMAGTGPVTVVANEAGSGTGAFVAIFALATLIMAVIAAYTALPLYRLLEGYHLPKGIATTLRNRHIREWRRLKLLEEFYDTTGRPVKGYSPDAMLAYPPTIADIMPTQLGNALRSLERFGVSRYGLDSQLLWYELQGVSSPQVRLDTEEGRGPVDFFVSSIAHLALLATLGTYVGVRYSDQPQNYGILIALVSLALIPLAYRNAVKNMKDWANSVKALVNLNRQALATALGMSMPATLEEERHMWESYIGAIEWGDQRFIEYYDDYRRPLPRQGSRSLRVKPGA